MTTINNKELIELVSQQSTHFKYIVEDVLYALAVVIQEQISEGNEVKIKGLGVFSLKQPRRIRNYSVYTGKHMDKYTKRNIKFKPDTLMLNYLNKEGAAWVI